MIKLSSNSQYSYLANPPTYAKIVSVTLTTWPVVNLNINYILGTLDSNNNFDASVSVPTVIISLPNPSLTVGLTEQNTILNILNTNGVVPTPGNPQVPLPSSAALAGQYHLSDIDTIVSAVYPSLAGTVV